MKRPTSLIFACLALSASFLASCESLSTDPAAGGIKASETGMNLESLKDWQDRSIRQLAY